MVNGIFQLIFLDFYLSNLVIKDKFAKDKFRNSP